MAEEKRYTPQQGKIDAENYFKTLKSQYEYQLITLAEDQIGEFVSEYFIPQSKYKLKGARKGCDIVAFRKYFYAYNSAWGALKRSLAKSKSEQGEASDDVARNNKKRERPADDLYEDNKLFSAIGESSPKRTKTSERNGVAESGQASVGDSSDSASSSPTSPSPSSITTSVDAQSVEERDTPQEVSHSSTATFFGANLSSAEQPAENKWGHVASSEDSAIVQYQTSPLDGATQGIEMWISHFSQYFDQSVVQHPGIHMAIQYLNNFYLREGGEGSKNYYYSLCNAMNSQGGDRWTLSFSKVFSDEIMSHPGVVEQLNQLEALYLRGEDWCDLHQRLNQVLLRREYELFIQAQQQAGAALAIQPYDVVDAFLYTDYLNGPR